MKISWQNKKLCGSFKGNVVIEFLLVVILVAGIVFGLGRQLIRAMHELDHYALVTELLLGPQERSLRFDVATGEVVKLDNEIEPTLTQFMDTVGNHFVARAPDPDYAAYFVLAHVLIDPQEGTVVEVDDIWSQSEPVEAFSYAASPGNECIQSSEQLLSWIKRYSNWQMKKVRHLGGLVAGGEGGNQWWPTPVDGNDDTGRFGAKLYDIENEGQRERRYEPLFPFLFAIVCSDMQVLGVSQRILTYHTIVPRRHIN